MTKRPTLTVIDGATGDATPASPPTQGVTDILRQALADHLAHDTSACVIIRVGGADSPCDSTYVHLPANDVEGQAILRDLHFYIHRAAMNVMHHHSASITSLPPSPPSDDGGA